MNNDLIATWEEALGDIVILHQKIKQLDKSLEKLYPVAITKDNTFYVFDFDDSDKQYHFKLEQSIPNMQIPDKILASFPLDFYYNKPAAVISDDALYEIEKQVFIFHEFVHCYQYLNGEDDIKNTLEIYKRSQAENNYMWEINHAFPYEDNIFTEKIDVLIEYYLKNEYDRTVEIYKHMKANLSNIDYEYFIWQEFKEGYARFVENKIRGFLNLELNDNTPNSPFDRALFYWTGSHHIDSVISAHKKEYSDLIKLFELMNI